MKSFSKFSFILLPVLIIVIAANVSLGQKVIFLHHSTGEGVYSGGNVAQWFKNYNALHSTSYTISERSYPNSPYPWDNYPFDYWNLWINGTCNNDNKSVECMDKLTQSYDVIIFKHCFPGADIKSDNGSETVNSSRKSLGNYKLQYRALRDLMDSYPKTRFIVWTLAPLHRNATTPANASRASQFVDWVKNDWLKEDLKTHENIFIFDFFGLTSELNESPANGLTNCLKYDYEGDHNGSDSHPNSLANRTVGPLFAQTIVDAINTKITSLDQNKPEECNFCVYPNPVKKKMIVELGELFRPNIACTLKIVNSLNQTIYQTCTKSPTTTIEFKSDVPQGLYFIEVFDPDGDLVGTNKIIIQ